MTPRPHSAEAHGCSMLPARRSAARANACEVMRGDMIPPAGRHFIRAAAHRVRRQPRARTRTPDTVPVPSPLTARSRPHASPNRTVAFGHAITAPVGSRPVSAPYAAEADPPEMASWAAVAREIRCRDQPPEENPLDRSPVRCPSSRPGVHVRRSRPRRSQCPDSTIADPLPGGILLRLPA